MPPPNVATGQNVASAWGNAVVADLATHTSQIANKANTYGVNYFTADNFFHYDGPNTCAPSFCKAGTWIAASTGAVVVSNDVGSDALSCFIAILRDAGDYLGKSYVSFRRYTSEIGSITNANGSSINYNTTSDPRLKTPPETAGFAEGGTTGIADAAERVQQLGAQAWVGHWIDPINGDIGEDAIDFLSSHDVEDVAPYAVTGQRDAVAGPPQSEHDPEEGSPVYQQVDYSALVPLLTAALSQALDRIDALEARVATLESA